MHKYDIIFIFIFTSIQPMDRLIWFGINFCIKWFLLPPDCSCGNQTIVISSIYQVQHQSPLDQVTIDNNIILTAGKCDPITMQMKSRATLCTLGCKVFNLFHHFPEVEKSSDYCRDVI
jgi:hypothetical protein